MTRAEKVAAMVGSASSVVALTGAGISVPSGIPDFRSPGSGLWENVNPMEVAHIDAWRSEPARFWDFYGQRFTMLDGMRPNAAHDALVELERRGLLGATVTQNIDMLHRKAGARDVVEVHGTIETSSCLGCGHREELESVRAKLAAAEDGVPRCPCGAPLKPDVVLFGELLPERAIEAAQRHAAAADVLLCVGTSLEVHPVAGLPEIAAANGAEVVLVTQGPTPWDGRAAAKLDGDVVAELEAVLAALDG